MDFHFVFLRSKAVVWICRVMAATFCALVSSVSDATWSQGARLEYEVRDVYIGSVSKGLWGVLCSPVANLGKGADNYAHIVQCGRR